MNPVPRTATEMCQFLQRAADGDRVRVNEMAAA
jgi:hypothetical protein